MTVKNKLLILLLLIGYFSVAYSVMHRLGITCVFLELFGVPCPGCGMTRAALSLLRLDFAAAARYNITVFFMPYVFAFVFLNFKHKVHRLLLVLIALIAVVNWAIKIAILF